MRRLFFFMSALGTIFNLHGGEAIFPWVVYYNDKAPTEAFEPYNPIILDSDDHPSLGPLLQSGKEVLGYIDLAEAEEYRSWFQRAKERGILLYENPDWPQSWIVDIRDPFWKELLINEVISEIIDQGFTGLFFDQLDIPIWLEIEDPKKYKGMTTAAVDLVRSIRKAFPNTRLMLNRAYEILPEVGHDIDYELAETLYTGINFEDNSYFIRSKEEYAWQMGHINKARKMFPHLVVFSLDYWYPKDKEMYRKIYALQRKNCIRPYVSTLKLDTIIPEPL